MKQRWVLQGKIRAESNDGWLNLVDYRKRKDARIDKVRARAKDIDLRADYRVVLLNVEEVQR